MAAPSATSSLPPLLENCENLTNLDDIRKAYDDLCKEEVFVLFPEHKLDKNFDEFVFLFTVQVYSSDSEAQSLCCHSLSHCQ